MRFVIYGAGGVGGTLGARLHIAGFKVVLIARGEHGKAIARDGLHFLSPALDVVLDIPCAAHPIDAAIGPDDAVLLCVKGQSTEGALHDLYAATGGNAHVVCCQNGVENERLALRRFERVYGMAVWLPAEHLHPGEVVNFAEGTAGGLVAGAYPAGADAFIEAVASALATAGFSASTHSAVMGHKHRKLLANLDNAVEAAVVPGAGDGDPGAKVALLGISRMLRREARACFKAAGLYCASVEAVQASLAGVGNGEVPGRVRRGGSTLQSVLRGAGDVETDFLNGEIVLLGRLHGVPTPANEAVQEVGKELVRQGLPAGSLSAAELQRRVAEAMRRKKS